MQVFKENIIKTEILYCNNSTFILQLLKADLNKEKVFFPSPYMYEDTKLIVLLLNK